MDKNVWIVVIAYLLMINVWGFLLCLIDKRKAVRKQWRIPERRFFLTALLGGGPGVLAGMYKFRHKTKHKTFTLGIPAIVGVWCVLMITILYVWR